MTYHSVTPEIAAQIVLPYRRYQVESGWMLTPTRAPSGRIYAQACADHPVTIREAQVAYFARPTCALMVVYQIGAHGLVRALAGDAEAEHLRDRWEADNRSENDL